MSFVVKRHGWYWMTTILNLNIPIRSITLKLPFGALWTQNIISSTRSLCSCLWHSTVAVGGIGMKDDIVKIVYRTSQFSIVIEREEIICRLTLSRVSVLAALSNYAYSSVQRSQSHIKTRIIRCVFQAV